MSRKDGGGTFAAGHQNNPGLRPTEEARRVQLVRLAQTQHPKTRAKALEN